MDHINAEVISIGTEILLGELTDTNSVFIARVLRDLGINLYFMTSVGDNEERIQQAIEHAFARARIVITCGGLGPTIDDMTRQSVANATKRDLVFHQRLLDQIAERFASFNAPMTANNRRQAYLPDQSIVVENPVGTAPAFIVEHDDRVVISLPGVPREMKYLMTNQIIPYLHQRYNLGVIKARILKTAGIGESALDDLLGDDLLEQGNPSIGLAAHSGQIDIRITAKAKTESDADDLIAITEAQIRERAATHIFGADNDDLETVVINLLKQMARAIVVVEVGTGPTIASALKANAHSDDVIIDSYQFTDTNALCEALSLDRHPILRDLTHTVAKQYYDETKAATIVVVSNPDIDEGNDADETSVVTVYTPSMTRQRSYGFGAKSSLAKSWIKSWALSSVWRLIKNQNTDIQS